MELQLPIKKSIQDINFYKKYGPKFGKILNQLRVDLLHGRLKTPKKIDSQFFELCWKAFSCFQDMSFPFETRKNYLDKEYDYTICVSRQDSVGHQPPDNIPFKNGEIISVDCGLQAQGLHFDAAFTTTFNDISPDWVNAPYETLKMIKQQQPTSTKEIASIIQEEAERNLLDIVVSLSGHGIGYKLHEPPQIRNARGDFANTEFFEGLCFCAEPIYVLPKQVKSFDNYNIQIAKTYLDSDGWTIKTIDKQPATHFETMFCFSNGTLIDLTEVSNWRL